MTKQSTPELPLPERIERVFIERWGDMGAAWGINRTMAQIQGLLYITGETLSTDEVMERLNVSRGNANMSLRALCDWGVLRKVHRQGDRRDYYESLTDVWEIFTKVAAQRKRKEIDPILSTLRRCEAELKEATKLEKTARIEATHERLANMLMFLTLIDSLSDRFVNSDRGLAKAIALLFGQSFPTKPKP